ncbi:hypothetical protein F4861DRAFT_215479 [Xylaria intraflava]|nr:hypothetical protein F4861DRAFT_215479 [Xylaria intraflava]
MLAAILPFSLCICASVGAIPQYQNGHVTLYDVPERGQTKIITVVVRTFNFSRPSTVIVGGPAPPATISASPASSESSSAASGSVTTPGSIPSFSFFPSTTILVNPDPTDQPSTGERAGNETEGQSKKYGQIEGKSLTGLLQGLLDLLRKWTATRLML